MFAHQVIEDLSGVEYVEEEFNKMIPSLISDIKSAPKFHLGQTWDINYPLRNRTTLWTDADLRLPYDCCYFDMFATFGKCAALVAKTGTRELPVWEIAMFFHLSRFSRWSLFPYRLSVKDPSAIGECTIYSTPSRLDAMYDVIVCKIRNVIATALTSGIVLLNCKNIVTETILPPEALNKKRRRSGKQELLSYHVLNVTVPSSKHGYRGAAEQPSHNRVHLCRGHFKEYTAAHPLMGRLVGRYWWQPHVRGQNRQGVVMKDYKVTTQAGAQA